LKRFFCLLVFTLLAYWPAAAQTQAPIRVNCGGPSYTDSSGNVWQADADFKGGSVSKTQAHVSGTSDPALFQDGRLNTASTPLLYSFPVADGKYHVNLYFAETNPSDQKMSARVFDVKMQGNYVFRNLDIFANAGADGALIKEADVSVTNGMLSVEFDNVIGDALIDAIEILPGTSGPILTLNFKYPDGTPVLGTLGYAVTSSLLSFQGSQALVNGSAQSALFANPSSLGISVQFSVKLSLTDNAGHTLWQLNLGMNPAQVNLGGVQSSSLNVVVQKM
jgi:Malectin domain